MGDGGTNTSSPYADSSSDEEESLSDSSLSSSSSSSLSEEAEEEAVDEVVDGRLGESGEAERWRGGDLDGVCCWAGSTLVTADDGDADRSLQLLSGMAQATTMSKGWPSVCPQLRSDAQDAAAMR